MTFEVNCWACGLALTEAARFCQDCGHCQSNPNSSPLYVIDTSTGLFNAVYMQATLEQETNRAIRYQRPLSVLVAELDYADRLGADLSRQALAGLLGQVGEVLVRWVRDTDTVGSLSTEPPRFAVILPETDLDHARLAADKMRKTITVHDFEGAGSWQRLSASVGAATIEHERVVPQDLFQMAVEALYEGRMTGPDRTHATAHL